MAFCRHVLITSKPATEGFFVRFSGDGFVTFRFGAIVRSVTMHSGSL